MFDPLFKTCVRIRTRTHETRKSGIFANIPSINSHVLMYDTYLTEIIAKHIYICALYIYLMDQIKTKMLL